MKAVHSLVPLLLLRLSDFSAAVRSVSAPLPSVINIEPCCSYPVFNLSTWHFSPSVSALGNRCVTHFHASHFWCWVFKEMRPSIQQEGIPSSLRHQQHPEYYTRNVRAKEEGAQRGNDARASPCQGQAPALKFRVNSAHQGGGSAVCHCWRALSK